MTECFDNGPTPVRVGSDARFAAIADTTDELVWEVDRDGIVLFMGPTVTEFLGYEQDELVGRSLLVAVPEFDQARALELIAVRQYPAFGWRDVLGVYVAKDGSLRSLISNGVAHVDDAGHAVGFAGTLGKPDRVHPDVLLNVLRGQVRHVIDADELTIVFQPITCDRAQPGRPARVVRRRRTHSDGGHGPPVLHARLG